MQITDKASANTANRLFGVPVALRPGAKALQMTFVHSEWTLFPAGLTVFIVRGGMMGEEMKRFC